MKIAIIGAGNVGGTLGKRWAKIGHQIQFGVRNAAKLEVVALLKEMEGRADAAGVADASSFGEVVVLTTPWNATRAALQSAGDLAGKVVVDCTNPLKPDLSGLTLGLETSAGEQVAQWAKGARVVKCFNTTGAPNMARPDYGGQPLTMFLCGDDPDAKATVAALAEQIGFEPADAGPLTAARLLEPLAMLWIHLAFAQGWGTGFGLRVVRR
jgi:predicted dinucleotide-binding enzyme